jgi:hypothetical protein
MSISGSQSNLQLWSLHSAGFEEDDRGQDQESGSKRQVLLRQSDPVLGTAILDHFGSNNPLYVSEDRVGSNPDGNVKTASDFMGALTRDENRNTMLWETGKEPQSNDPMIEEPSDNDSTQSFESIFYSDDDEEGAPISFDLYDTNFNAQGNLVITKKKVQFDKSHQSNFPICNGIDTCNDPHHLKSGVLTPTHNRENTEDCQLYNHILSLLCTTANEKNLFSCIKCTEATNKPFNEIKLHVRNNQGNELGPFLNKPFINKSIHRLCQNRVNKSQDWEIDPIPLICLHCGVRALDRFDYFLHVTLEHGVMCENKNYCPDCFTPILSGNLVGHVNDTHEASCNLCNKNF